MHFYQPINLNFNNFSNNLTKPEARHDLPQASFIIIRLLLFLPQYLYNQ